jgi:hypothetical protein
MEAHTSCVAYERNLHRKCNLTSPFEAFAFLSPPSPIHNKALTHPSLLMYVCLFRSKNAVGCKRDKFQLITCHEGIEGSRGLTYSSFNLGARWGGWSTPPLGRFYPGLTRYPLYRRVVGPQGRSGRVQIISRPLGFDARIVTGHSESYAVCAIPVHYNSVAVMMTIVKVMPKNGAFTLEQSELIKSARHVDTSCHGC